MRNLYATILEQSGTVDRRFERISDDELYSFKLKFEVPKFHPRYEEIKAYVLQVTSLGSGNFIGNQLIVVDRGIERTFVGSIIPRENSLFENANEETFKEWNWVNAYLAENHVKERYGAREVMAVGGGLTLNVAAYIAELLGTSLTLVPTTVIGMADGSGGKVRLNLIDYGRRIKHYYKSYFEPNGILIDPRFLDTLSERQVSIGLGEIVKHGLYQSGKLMDYLVSSDFDPNRNRKSLLKAILWAAALKEVCLRIDVEENANGSRTILRGGHEFSDRIEEDSRFSIPHGFAVAMGIYKELSLRKGSLLPLFVEFCERHKIPLTVENFRSTEGH